MTFNYIKKEDLVVSTWSGGTTTQLAIGPDGSDYQRRVFGWRVSTATVEVEKSTFTPLPGITRYIMSLEGNLYLSHEGEYSIDLYPYEVDCFKGDFKTVSVGQVTDFNLMLSEETKGHLKAQRIDGQVTLGDLVTFENSKVVLYSKNSSFQVACPSESLTVEAGGVLIIEGENKADVTLKADHTWLVIAEIII